MLAVFLGAAVLVGTAGLAFAAGRASAPATDTAAVSSGEDLSRDRGTDEGKGDLNPMQNHGLGPMQNHGLGPMQNRGLDGLPPGGGLTREGVGGGGITGTVAAVDADSLTITTESGLTVTVGLDGTTTYHQATDAQASDVTVGATVEVSVAGRFRPRDGSEDGLTLGTASDVTIVP